MFGTFAVRTCVHSMVSAFVSPLLNLGALREALAHAYSSDLVLLVCVGQLLLILTLTLHFLAYSMSFDIKLL